MIMRRIIGTLVHFYLIRVLFQQKNQNNIFWEKIALYLEFLKINLISDFPKSKNFLR